MRLLIANRGEIAVRIIRACREMGISPVAVYSEADRDSSHVSLADAAFCIGPPPASESYLRSEIILEAAKEANADAIHPGYGFLSENADFAQACAEAGFIFVGPPAEVMRALGDKIHAKERMSAAGVPVVPGYHGASQEDSALAKEAAQVGFPLLIKAACGGGGRGMRLVECADDFASALAEARQEAESAFGDPRVLLEKFIERPRHVEVQIFGDSHGNVIHLFERECSIQRRHQKIIEESPCPILTDDVRARITEAAVAAGKAAGYVNAGTVEFLLEEQPDGDHRFYFLEVNTRLQVEHPVTEMRTGIDLAKLQIRVAQGESLGLSQADITTRGHAIEVRIYAEDPSTGFLPSVGRIAQWMEPCGPWIRVDSGVRKDSEVSPYYDPMLAKLIVLGESREDAVARIEQALMRFHVLGIRTNIPYLLTILRDSEFRAGKTHTGLLAERFGGWKPDTAIPPEVLLALAAESVSRPSRRVDSGSSDSVSPWQSTTGWRNSGARDASGV